MKNRRVILLLPLAFALTAPLGFSQSSGSGGGNGSSTVAGNGSAAASNAGAVANITTSTTNNGGGRQFIQALPGVADPVFPGYALKNEPCHLLYIPPLRHLTMDQVRSMAKGNKLNKHQMHIDVVDSNAIADNDDPIDFVPYWVKAIADPNDRILASVVIPGKYLHTEEELIGVALIKAKKISHARRYSAKECPEVVSHTSAHGGGFGGSFASVPGGGTTANAVSLGFSFGVNDAAEQEHQVLYLVALNDGPLDVPVIPRQPEPARAEAPTTPPPQPQQATPPVQTVRIEVAVVPQTLQPLTPPPAPEAVMPSCNLPSLTVYFDFDKSDIKDKYRAPIKSIANWLENHPACKVQVQGHASKEASFGYNDVLGDQRASAVYKLLLANGAPMNKLEHASLSKYFPKGDYEPNNRRVILVVQGSASGR